MRLLLLLGTASLALGLSGQAGAQSTDAVPAPHASCSADPAYHLLDFWIGSWEVYAGTTLDGHDRVSRILGGCALTEEWTDTGGGKGLSLFYLEPASGRWHQVWVTDRANLAGGLKEKILVEQLPGGGVRFQGTITGPRGRSYLDRTTLTPRPSGEVHQVIEASTDSGATWRSLYDAIYRKVP
jgi:hypothetical protein